jgi:DNA polymerase III subunit gamma/tau
VIDPKPAPNQSLYRQWRPKRFGEMVGQDAVVRTLQNAVKSGQVAHAYLFAGERGIGKTSAARILARAVNCQAPEGGEPCNLCDHCRTILANRTLDIVEIDGASNRGIDHIRQLREEVSFSPTDLLRKVYIIDEVHMLTHEAFNALLKTLEEPPAHVMFVFATTEPHKVPRTILSRCQTFDFRRIETEAMVGHLATVASSIPLEISKDALGLIAHRANGGMRDALVMMEQAASYGEERVTAEAVLDMLGLADRTVHEAFLSAIEDGDQATLITLIDELVERGKDLEVFLADVVDLLRGRLRIPSARTSTDIRLSQGLLAIKADMFRSLDRRVRFEVGVLALMDRSSRKAGRPSGDRPRAKPTAPAASDDAPHAPTESEDEPAAGRERGRVIGSEEQSEVSPGEGEDPPPPDAEEPQASREPLPEACKGPWEEMLTEIQQDRIAIAAYLVEAAPQISGDALVISFHPEHSFHKESLEIRDNLTYLSGAARRHFGDRIHVEIRTDDSVSRKPLPHEILMEKAKLVCEAVDGKILKEEM